MSLWYKGPAAPWEIATPSMGRAGNFYQLLIMLMMPRDELDKALSKWKWAELHIPLTAAVVEHLQQDPVPCSSPEPSLSPDWNRNLKFILMSLAHHCCSYFQDSSTSQVNCEDCETFVLLHFPLLCLYVWGGWFGPHSGVPRTGSHQQWSIKICLDNLRPTDPESETNSFPTHHFRKYF